MCGAARNEFRGIVDNVKQKKRMNRYSLHQPAVPSWWLDHFEPVWKPFLQRLCRQKNITWREFERAASQVPGLTHIEKTIAISAFHQQQERLVSLHNTTAFRSEHNLSAV